jgi:AraC family transcriptional regulator
MSSRAEIQKIVDFVENHIEERLSVDTLADVGGFSKFHLNRLFSIYTGFSLMGYVRHRKLTHAVQDLHEDVRILDIATAYGYSSERAFSRAFLNEFGASPSHFRNRRVPMTEKLQIVELDLGLIEGVKQMPDYLSDVKYRTINAMDVICARTFSESPEEEVMGALEKYAESMGLKVGRNFGFDVPVSEEESEQGVRGYEYWLEVKAEELNKVSLPDTFEGFEIWHMAIDTHRYASLRITDPFADPFERIGLGWKSLVQWMEKNDLHLQHQAHGNENPYCLEEVVMEDGVTCMDIFIPVD